MVDAISLNSTPDVETGKGPFPSMPMNAAQQAAFLKTMVNAIGQTLTEDRERMQKALEQMNLPFTQGS